MARKGTRIGTQRPREVRAASWKRKD